MSEYLPKIDVWVTQTQLPGHVRAFCKRVGFDECAVVNEDLDDDVKREAVMHEIDHVEDGDLDKELAVPMIETKKRRGWRV